MKYARCSMPFCLAVSLATTLFVLGRGVVARPLTQLSASHLTDFQEALKAIAEQGHVTLVAEGVPNHPRLSQQEVAKLTIQTSLDDEVKVVAAAYDYDSQRLGNVFVLKKRYSNPDELPALTQSECASILTLLQKVSDPFNPHALPTSIKLLVPPATQLRRDQFQVINPLLDRFAASLTPAQMEAMHMNNLSMSSLSQDQKALARQVQLLLYIQHPLESIAELSSELEAANRDAVFCWHDTDSSRHVFGYTLPKQPGDWIMNRFHPLSRFIDTDKLDLTDTSPQPTSPDPTNPDPVPASVQSDVAPSQTLADVVAELNTQPGTPHTDVDASVATKPITLVGGDNTPVLQVLQGLANVYSLRLLTSPAGNTTRLVITLPSVSPPSDITDLPSSLRHTLPDPFARAIHLDRMVAEEQQFHDFWQVPVDSKRPAKVSDKSNIEETRDELEQSMQERRRSLSGPNEFVAATERIKQAEATLPALRIVAIRRLRTLIEPKLKLKPAGVALADLGEQEHEALTIIYLIDATQSLIKLLTQPTPDSILNSDHTVLGGGLQKDSHPPMFSVAFSTQTPDGRTESDGGAIAVEYIKDYGKPASAK